LDLFNIIGGVASLFGLVISVWTLIVAQSARKAALEAKEAVYEGSAAEELHLLTRLANDFLNSVQNDRTAEGLVRSRDLIAGIALSKQRWSRFLDKGSRTKLEKASLQIRIAARVLATKGAPDNDKEKERLIEIADEIVNLLGTEAGKLSSLQESGKL
jgi:hypothetical protein